MDYLSLEGSMDAAERMGQYQSQGTVLFEVRSASSHIFEKGYVKPEKTSRYEYYWN